MDLVVRLTGIRFDLPAEVQRVMGVGSDIVTVFPQLGAGANGSYTHGTKTLNINADRLDDTDSFLIVACCMNYGMPTSVRRLMIHPRIQR